MSENIQLIRKKIEHLKRMRMYLDYSLAQTLPLLPIADFQTLTPGPHETLAAFRVRFSELQEQLEILRFNLPNPCPTSLSSY